jgi:hypothetical protein
MTQAVVVGGIAFAGIIAAAGGVFWFTAKAHRERAGE